MAMVMKMVVMMTMRASRVTATAMMIVVMMVPPTMAMATKAITGTSRMMAMAMPGAFFQKFTEGFFHSPNYTEDIFFVRPSAVGGVARVAEGKARGG